MKISGSDTKGSQLAVLKTAESSSTKFSSSAYLSDLIGAGADAQSNLFQITFSNESLDNIYTRNLQIRTQDFPAPNITVQTTSFSYQNIEVTKAIPSSNFDRKLVLKLRLDQDYLVYQGLKKTLCINELGSFSLDESKAWIISVDALHPESNKYSAAMGWMFYECYLIELGSMNYSYSSAEALTVPATFTYKYFEVKSAESEKKQNLLESVAREKK